MNFDTEQRSSNGQPDCSPPLGTDQSESPSSQTPSQGVKGVKGRKRAAKLFHKKSRTGCQRCRARRVKCNEGKPICHNCERLGLSCVYDRKKSVGPGTGKQPERLGSMDSQLPFEDAQEPEECEGRRKLELQLFGHYITETGPSIAVDRTSYDFWVTLLCRKAFKSNALLYAVYFMTALHMAKIDGPTNASSMDVCHSYLKLAIREHQKELNQLSRDNVDIVCLTSSVFRVYSFITLQERVIHPYTPPMEWLMVACSSCAVFQQAADLIKEDDDSAVGRLFNTVPVLLDDEARDAAMYRQDLMHLLQRCERHELAETWDADIQAAYESTLSYIGSIWMDMNNRNPPGNIGRRLIIFPMVVRKRFVDLVAEQRPRALVVLAHYFALLAMLKGFWWIGDVGSREVYAIASVIPMEWNSLMAWPLQILEEQAVFAGEY